MTPWPVSFFVEFPLRWYISETTRFHNEPHSNYCLLYLPCLRNCFCIHICQFVLSAKLFTLPSSLPFNFCRDFCCCWCNKRICLYSDSQIRQRSKPRPQPVFRQQQPPQPEPAHVPAPGLRPRLALGHAHPAPAPAPGQRPAPAALHVPAPARAPHVERLPVRAPAACSEIPAAPALAQQRPSPAPRHLV